MKIEIHTSDAAKLKATIIADAKNEKLNTWVYKRNDEDEFITHSPDQWFDKVILEFIPSKDNKTLTVKPCYWEGYDIPTKDDYGTILGRFSERLFVQYRCYLDSFESFV